jgi:hypothetical protein
VPFFGCPSEKSGKKEIKRKREKKVRRKMQ